MDKIGPMARTAADCATILEAISGNPVAPAVDDAGAPPGPPFRLAVLRGGTDGAQPAVRDNFEISLGVLAGIADLEEVDLPDLPFDEAANIVILAEGAAAFEEFIASGAAAGLTAPEDRIGLYEGLTLPAVDYLRALRIRRLGGRALDGLLAPFDAILAPTLRRVAPPISGTFSDLFEDHGPALGAAGNLCGLPAITVPNGFGDGGLPTGLEFMGRAYGEARLLAAARAYQERTDWHTRRPPQG